MNFPYLPLSMQSSAQCAAPRCLFAPTLQAHSLPAAASLGSTWLMLTLQPWWQQAFAACRSAWVCSSASSSSHRSQQRGQQQERQQGKLLKPGSPAAGDGAAVQRGAGENLWW